MIIDSDLIASFDFMTDFNGIDRYIPDSFYPAGVYDSDKRQYKYGPNSIEYPVLKLPKSIYDKAGNEISPGYYMVRLSDERTHLNLYQSNKLKARVKVIKLVEEMRTQEELQEEENLKGAIKKYEEKQNLKKLRKAQEDYKAFLESEAAKNYANIVDSGKGYYVVNYNCYGKKATGIIQK